MDTEKEKSIESLKEHIEKVRGLIDYHILTAGDYVLQIQSIEKMIEERKVENEKIQ